MTALTPRLAWAARLTIVASLTGLTAGAIVPRAWGQQPTSTSSGARVTAQGLLVDFQDAEVRTVVIALAEAAGINVTFGDLPSRRITLRIRQPVPIDSVRGLLRSVAESNGLRVTESGGLLRFDNAAPPPTVAPSAPVQLGGPRLYVYQLRHARAARLAGTLQAIFGGGVAGPDAAEAGPSSLSQRLRESQIPPLRLDTLNRGRDVALGVPVLAGRVQSQVQIVPDENTNALLVRAVPADWEVIRQAIAAVDLRPMQVLIEVLVAEVRRTSELDVGVEVSARQRSKAGDTRATGDLTGSGADPSTGEVLLKWMNGGSLDIAVALRALSARGDVRILSRPVLLAQNNQEAHILVGSQRPFVQVFRSLPTDAGVRDQIVQYRDVGTSLTITPTVNPDGYVNLELLQEVSSATAETQFGAPVISTREARTYLFVRDGQTTVIGGLIDRQAEKSRSGIPVLASIPVLGALFGTTHNTTVRSELFLFLTPHVVRTDDELDRLRDSVEHKLQLLERELPKVAPVTTTAPPPVSGAPAGGTRPLRQPADSVVHKPEPLP